jgi:hypothetical protein
MSLELGKAYSHAGRIVQLIVGVPFISVSNISWDVATNRDFNFGTGKKPISYGEGADEPVQVKISISKSDFLILQASTVSTVNPVGDVLRLAPFDVYCTDTHPQAPVNSTIKNFYIKSWGESSALNDTDIMIELTGIATAVEFI